MWFRDIFSDRKKTVARAFRPQVPSIQAVLEPQVLRQLDRLRLDTGLLRLAASSGSRTSSQQKPSSNFQVHRAYAPGDDVRYVDWKASARQEHVFIKQGEQEKAAVIYVLIDTSASMAWGGPFKQQAALNLANVLGYLALAQQDRLVILPVSDEQAGSLHPLGPLSGKGQAPSIKKYLEALKFSGKADITRTMVGLTRRGLSQSGMVIVISDMLGVSDLERGLQALRPPAWKTVCLHLLHPDELSPRLDGFYEMYDVETHQKQRYRITPKALETYAQRLKDWRADLDQKCQENKATYTLISSAALVDKEIIPQLRRVHLVKPL